MSNNLTKSITDKSGDKKNGTFTSRLIRGHNDTVPRYEIRLYRDEKSSAEVSVEDLRKNIRLVFTELEDLKDFASAINKATAQFEDEG